MSGERRLPRGWTRATIGDLVAESGLFRDGDWVESDDQDPDGDVRLIQLADVGDGEYRDRSNRFLTRSKAKELNCTFLEPGDVLIARMPDPLGRACIFPGDAKMSVTVVDVCIVRTGRKDIDHRWLQWFINAPHFRVQVAGLQSGSTRKRISRRNLATLTLPVPPGKEQRRIVAKIEEMFSDLDAGVAALERVRANLKRYRAAVLKSAVEGRLTAEWRKRNPDVEPASTLLERILAERRAKWERDQLRKFKEAGKTPPKGWKEKYEEPPSPKDVDGTAIPSTWSWATIDQLIAGDRSSAYGVLQPGDDVPDGVPLVRVCDVADGRVAVDQLKRIAPGIAAQFSRTVLRGGEVLLTIVGTIGRTAIAPETLRGANTARAVAVLPTNEIISARFVEMMLRDSTARTKLTLAAHEVARKTLNLEDVRIACVPLAPLTEQAEIVAEVDRRLSVADAAEAQVEHALQRAARLRQAILKRAFEGKLVPQDPSDEPASILLERRASETVRTDAASRPRNRRSSGGERRSATRRKRGAV